MKTITKQLLVDSFNRKYSNALIFVVIIAVLILIECWLRFEYKIGVLIVAAVLVAISIFAYFLFRSDIKKLRNGKFYIIEDELVYMRNKEMRILIRFHYEYYYYYIFEFSQGYKYTLRPSDEENVKNPTVDDEVINNSRIGDKFYLVVTKNWFSKKGRVLKIFSSKFYEPCENEFVLEDGKYLCRKNVQKSRQ